jgi:hypothetical protein
MIDEENPMIIIGDNDNLSVEDNDAVREIIRDGVRRITLGKIIEGLEGVTLIPTQYTIGGDIISMDMANTYLSDMPSFMDIHDSTIQEDLNHEMEKNLIVELKKENIELKKEVSRLNDKINNLEKWREI